MPSQFSHMYVVYNAVRTSAQAQLLYRYKEVYCFIIREMSVTCQLGTIEHIVLYK